MAAGRNRGASLQPRVSAAGPRPFKTLRRVPLTHLRGYSEPPKVHFVSARDEILDSENALEYALGGDALALALLARWTQLVSDARQTADEPEPDRVLLGPPLIHVITPQPEPRFAHDLGIQGLA